MSTDRSEAILSIFATIESHAERQRLLMILQNSDTFRTNPDEWTEAGIRADVMRAVLRAETAGFVATVTQVPLRPLAMRHYESVVSLRGVRK
jgi:hypothetical protein